MKKLLEALYAPVRKALAKELAQELQVEARNLYHLAVVSAKWSDQQYYADRWDFTLKMREDLMTTEDLSTDKFSVLDKIIIFFCRLFRR